MPRSSSGPPDRVSRTLVLVGALIYVIAWFVPTLDLGTKKVLAGWAAFLMSLWPFEGDGYGFYKGLIFASALSNLVLVGALGMVLIARRTPSGWVGVLLITFAILNLHWILTPIEAFDPTHRGGTAFREYLRIGYYLWVGSFFLVAAGVYLERRTRTRAISDAGTTLRAEAR